MSNTKQQTDALKIIEAVKRHPCLYNPHDSDNDRNKLLWRKIDDELGLRSSTSKATWNDLRRTHLTFRAYQQRVKNSSERDRTWPWRFEKEMSFIDVYEGGTDSVYREEHYEKKLTYYEKSLFSNCEVDEEKLIECVKEYPILIEIFNDNLDEQNEAWDAISIKMGYSAKFCQYWWTKLKNRYRKELWAYKKGKSTRWEHFYKMDFVKVNVSFNIADTSSLREPLGVISRYFDTLAKFLEKAPKDKRAELDNKILNLILEAELNHNAPKESLQDNSIEIINSPQSNTSENIISTNTLDNVQPIDKYIVKIIPDGETSTENVSEEYLINILPDDFNVDAPLIDCEVEEPMLMKEEVLKTEEEVENIESEEIKIENVNIEEENKNVEVIEEIDHTIKDVEVMEIQDVEVMEVKEEFESMEVKEEVETIEINDKVEETDDGDVKLDEDEEMVGCYLIEVTDD